ncbi:hypothetical protein LPJ61_002467 [Coemansia biformis]|uniref:Uncharacterized protein n=1 Tax=Coemansia biformis TaxID=1286918 RepID=A0A9W8CYM8_9FUNG|nr:hypothetical protein LPJ61_002467 [Coemansia biformis]
MRVLALLTILAACAVAAPIIVVRSSEPSAALHHSNSNSGDQKEGVLTDSSSLGGSTIVDPVGNTVSKVNENTDVHDNNIQDAVVNKSQDSKGTTVVGNSNKILRRGGKADGGDRKGTLESGADAKGATVTNPQNNELSQVNQNAEVSGNTLKDPTFNGITNNKGPAMAGNNNLFVPTTNEKGAIQFNDNGFMDSAAVKASGARAQ